MVKLTQPFLSTDATGKLGNALQFGHWKGRNVAGRRRRPKQPRTLEQRATRLWMTWLAKDWSSATAAQQATFEPPAKEWDLSPYNAFLRYNLRRLRNLPDRYTAIQGYDFFPTRYYTDPTTQGYDGITSVSTTGQVLSFTHRVQITYHGQGWFFSWHILDGGRTGVTYTGTIHIQNKLPIGFHDILIENIPAGFHEFVFGPVSYTGHPRVNFFKRNVTVLPS